MPILLKKLIQLCSSLIISVSLFSAVSAVDLKTGLITGKIAAEGGIPLSDWRVRLFDAKTGPSPFTNEYWRIPDHTGISGEDGRFTITVPEGTYYMIAIKQTDRKRSAIIGENDLVYPPLDSREQKTFIVKGGETTDIGVISGAVPFKKGWALQGKTGIGGIVFDSKGTPYQGVDVRASDTPDWTGARFHADSITDSEGRFIVRLPKGGSYYLKVRGHQHPDPVTVRTGEMTSGIRVQYSDSPQ